MKLAHLAAFAIGVTALACDPEYELELDAVSTTAPNLTTNYVQERERTSSKITSRSLTISRGAAIALRCERRNDPCEGLRVESSDAGIAATFRGARSFDGASSANATYASRINASGGGDALLVVVGVRTGATLVHLSDNDGRSAIIEVTVIEPPPP